MCSARLLSPSICLLVAGSLLPLVALGQSSWYLGANAGQSTI